MNETKRSFWRGILEFITGLNLAIKLITSIIVLAGALMGIFAAVGGFDEPEEKFTLTIYVEGQGTTHPSPGTYKYEEGHQIPITPVPDPGHEFDRWSGDYSGTSPTLSITMDTDKSITASFKAIPITPVEKFTITIAVAGKGTTSPFPGSHPYDEGQRVTITATPSSDYRFDHWEGNASDTSPSITITMDRDKSVTAYFVAPEPAPAPAPAPAKPAPAPPTPTPNQVVLQTVVNPTGGGTVNPSGGTYDSGPMVYVIATPSPNYQFVSWSGDVPADIRLSPDIWIPTDRDRNVTANFELIPAPTTPAPAPAPPAPPAVIVTFPDSNLEAAIRSAIGKPTGDITTDDLEGLTDFRAIEKGITDLTGLQYCTGLTFLVLGGNQIINISPLASLTNLTTIWADDNQISDISPLASLTNLTQLSLRINQISDISPLSSLINLNNLDMSYNQISNISPLASLTKLTDIMIFKNQIIDISPLASLTSLYYLHIGNNQINDISPLLENSGLGSGDVVYLLANPLSQTSINTYIPQLKARGVEVK